MPPGARAATSPVGVESSELGVVLHVIRDLEYAGSDPEVAEWLRLGAGTFEDLDAALAWLARVAPAPTGAAAPSTKIGTRRRPTPLPAGEVTSLSDVPVEAEQSSAVSELELREALLSTVAGQDDAVSLLASGVARHISKQFPRKPFSAMLIGPTAVGKTTAAETIPAALTALSEVKWDFIRLDMGEFSEKHSVARLTGAPPGYLGYGDECLASLLAGNPHMVVLFDEMEKAHPSVGMTIMNLLDRGRLDTERYGSVTATEAIVLFTSNLGADEIETGPWDDRDGRTHLLRHGFPPELVGRFGEILTFTNLSSEALVAVAVRSVATVAADYGVHVEWVAPAYLGDVLMRTRGNRLGVRAIEYLVDADLGEQFAGLDSDRARIDYEGVGIVHAAVEDDHFREGASIDDRDADSS
jgi:ATP-dependent Clp protease ATP-binding subunit ClpA